MFQRSIHHTLFDSGRLRCLHGKVARHHYFLCVYIILLALPSVLGAWSMALMPRLPFNPQRTCAGRVTVVVLLLD